MALDLRAKIINELPGLPDTVLEQIDRLIDEFKNRKNPANAYERFADLAGSISEEDAREMLEAIEDCERIDPDEWLDID